MSCPGSHHDQDEGVEVFFARNGFDVRTRWLCDEDARQRFHKTEMTLCQTQGYCSYTLALPDSHILQYRPEAFKLDLDVCTEAKAIYGGLAPTTTYLGAVEGVRLSGSTNRQPALLHAYLLEKIPGIPFSEFVRRPQFAENAREFRARLLGDLAGAYALSFHGRRDPGVFGGKQHIKDMRGRVGNSMRWRLNLLLKDLPGHLREHVSESLRQLDSIERSRWCFTHGDMLPANMMVDPLTGHLTGLIDWAEAEWLPFGMALYGVEEVLLESADKQKNSSSSLQFCEGEEELHRLFWDRLLDLSCRGEDDGMRPWMREVMTARKLGVLLWVGIAFDNGRIERVIEAGRDDAEMRKLASLLGAMRPILVDMRLNDGNDEDEARTNMAPKRTVVRRFWRRASAWPMSCMGKFQ